MPKKIDTPGTLETPETFDTPPTPRPRTTRTRTKVAKAANGTTGNGNGRATNSHVPSYDEIAEAAYLRYINRGSADGSDFDDWVEAERELKGRA